MKIFSLGFLLGSVRICYLHDWHLNSIKVLFDNVIVIIPSYIIAIFITWNFILSLYKCVNYKLIKHMIVYICKFIIIFYKCSNGKKSVHSILNKYFKVKKKVFNSKLKNEKPWQCLLIDGVWGSGKTTHYEKHYQYIDNNPNIYISCFSASRGELIAQIIQQQFWCKLLTLNGLLAKFMENNWQIFMPKNRVVVFDDLERLHANQDNYLDLIGIIDYLKDKKKCRVILICNMSELKELIFNTYMERIVNNIEFVPQLSRLAWLFKNSEEKHLYGHIDLNSPIIKKVIDECQKLYKNNKLNNLRIFKTSISDLASELNQRHPTLDKLDEKAKIIHVETYMDSLIKNISMRYLFFANYKLFHELVTFTLQSNSIDGAVDERNMESKDVLNKKTMQYFEEALSQKQQHYFKRELNKFSNFLELRDFKNGIYQYQIQSLLTLEFKTETCVMFAINNLHKLAQLNPKYIQAINYNIQAINNINARARTTSFHNAFAQAKNFIQIGAYKNQYADSLLMEWKKYIIQYVESYKLPIQLGFTFSTNNCNRDYYIRNFALALLFSKLNLLDHLNFIVDSIAMNLRIRRVPFDRVISSRGFYWEECGNEFQDDSEQMHSGLQMQGFKPNTSRSFRIQVLAEVLESYIYWFIDNGLNYRAVFKDLNLNFKKVLAFVEEKGTTSNYTYGENQVDS